MLIRSKLLIAVLGVGFAASQAACASAPDEGAGDPPRAEAIAASRSAGTPCDLSGTWATKTVVPVIWPATVALEAGQGTVIQYTKNSRIQNGTTFSDRVQVCGIMSPDYRGLGNQLFGVRFPPGLFDTNNFTVSIAAGTLTAAETGATYSLPEVLVLLGATMMNPRTEPWPNTPSGIRPAIGPNGKPGIPAVAASEPGYTFPQVNVLATRRAKAFQLALRTLGSSTGTIETCDRVTGSATVAVINGKPVIDNHVLACTATDGSDCSRIESNFLDFVSPVLAPMGNGTVVSVRVPDSATCADVRAAAF